MSRASLRWSKPRGCALINMLLRSYRIFCAVLACGAALGAFCTYGAVAAEAPFPAKPVRIIVPYPPGGLGDIFPRALATDRKSTRLNSSHT